MGAESRSVAIGSAHCLELVSKGLGNSAMESRHGREAEISNGNPRALLLSSTDVAKINVESQFEMGIGTVK